MATTTESIQQLYVAYFNRPADPGGLAYWLDAISNKSGSLKDVSTAFSQTAEYKASFAGLTFDGVINQVYQNLFNRAPDASGLAYWSGLLAKGTLTISSIVDDISSFSLNHPEVSASDTAAITNKVAAAVSFTNYLNTDVALRLAYSTPEAGVVAKDYIHQVVDATTLAAAVAGLPETTASLGGNGSTDQFTLTNGTDSHTANVFNAGLVYNPAGTDRINSLQSEDVLIGKSTTVDNVLNATLGNANDNGANSVTATLTNIQTINLDVTGNTNTLDVRFADSLKTLSINKLTAEAGNGIHIKNIGQVAANLTVKNSAAVDGQVEFNYINGVLKGTTAAGTAETGTLTLSNVAASVISIGNAVGEDGTQGFETLNLVTSGNNQVKVLDATDLENLVITGSGNLTLVNTTQQTDRVQYNGSAISIGDGLGIRTIDLKGFTGSASVDISAAVGGHADPVNSGEKYFATVTGSAGADTIWSSNNLLADSATLKDSLDGGAGVDTLKLIDAGIVRGASKAIATVTNVENVELRLQDSGSQTLNLAAFDAALVSVTLRNENSTGGQGPTSGTFELKEVGSKIAASGITLLHASGAGDTGVGTPSSAIDTVNIHLADATGTTDTVALTVKTNPNTSTTYNYDIGLETEKDATGAYKGYVENLTINDADNESNTVHVSGNDSKGNITALGVTGTVTLTGGSVGKTYTVATALSAVTVDASTQLSNLRLKVGQPTDTANYGTTVVAQTVKLGAGDDVLTFDGKDFLSGIDTVTDAGGTDTVRAYYSADGGVPVLTGIEKFQLMATANATIDLSKATGITELALLSDQAVETVNHALATKSSIFTNAPVAGGTDITTNVVTLANSNLSSVNFFGDTISTLGVSGQYTQFFNGLTLSNNAATALAVNINASLDAGNGVTAYNLGQLTAHGTTSITINVANEFVDATTATKDATTTIANIFAKDATALILKSAEGNINVGTVTGNATNNSLLSFDASAVGGNVVASVISLGDAAVVTLAGGDDTFSANGSAGKLIHINGGNGNNIITGSAQSDFITTGTGNDFISGGRGDNVITSGAGNDFIAVGDGNNTVNIGTGTIEFVSINDQTGLANLSANNVIAGTGTVAGFSISTDGLSTQYQSLFAVGAGSDLTMSFTGVNFNDASSTLNGRLVEHNPVTSLANSTAITNSGEDYNVLDSNSHFVYADALSSLINISGGKASDAIYALGTSNYVLKGGAGNDAIVVGTLAAGATVTGGTGADKIAFDTAHNAVELHYASGDSTSTAADTLVGFISGTDTIVFDAGSITIGVAADAAVAGKAQLDLNGVATFAAGDTTLASHIAAVASALGTSALGTSAVWTETNLITGIAHSYLYISDSFAGVSSNDIVVELVGTQTTGLDIDINGHITGFVGVP